MSGFEVRVLQADGVVVSQRRLARADTTIGGGWGCDVCLADVPDGPQLILRSSRGEVSIEEPTERVRLDGDRAPAGRMWPPGRALCLEPYTLHLTPFVAGTVTHRTQAQVARQLRLRAGGTTAPLDSDRATVIGSSKADLNLAHGSVAPRHARVEWRAGAYFIEDLDSGVGTRVDGRSVGRAGARLRAGTVIEVGDCAVHVEAEEGIEDFGLFGDSAAMRGLHQRLSSLFEERIIALVGETGTGKELAARALHDGKQRSGPFIAKNCATLLPTTSRAELFGHEQGAFSDAHEARGGLFGAADGGTLFLDEIVHLDAAAQAQLLRAFESGVVRSVGGVEREVDVHIIVAAKEDQLTDSVRSDLRARLSANIVRLPPLRERGEDVVRLAELFLRETDRAVGLSDAAKDCLRTQDWPGNVRELQNCISLSAQCLAPSRRIIEVEDVRLRQARSEGQPAPVSAEGQRLRALVVDNEGVLKNAAAAAGISHRTLVRRLEVEGVDVAESVEEGRAMRRARLMTVVEAAGSIAKAAAELDMPYETLRRRVQVLERTDSNTRKDLEARLEARGGNLSAVAKDLGVARSTVRRRARRLGIFGSGARGATIDAAAGLVIEKAGARVRHPVSGPGFCVGMASVADVRLEERDGPPVVAMVVQRGARLGLRVFGGPSVRAAGGLVLHARSLELDPGEVVRIGDSTLWLESPLVVPAPAARSTEPAVLREGEDRHPLSERAPFHIGSGPDVDLTVDDPHVSRTHTRIFASAGRWWVYDCASKNGTFVDGRAHESGPIRVPSTLQVGDVELRLEPAHPRAWTETLGFIGRSPPMQQVYDLIRRVSPAYKRILVTGETGTGKELAARAIHAVSGREKFVAINCGGIEDDAFVVELFGAVRGAFTGSTEDRPGLVEQADGGTLFLDEIGDLPASGQGHLLRLLQEGCTTRVGDTKERPVDVLVVAATNRDLHAMMPTSAFLSDLYYRFALEVALPPLRDRGEDVLEIAEYLLDGLDGWRLAPGAAESLRGRPWPANVRELRNNLAEAVRRAKERGGHEVTAADLA